MMMLRIAKNSRLWSRGLVKKSDKFQVVSRTHVRYIQAHRLHALTNKEVSTFYVLGALMMLGVIYARSIAAVLSTEIGMQSHQELVRPNSFRKACK